MYIVVTGEAVLVTFAGLMALRYFLLWRETTETLYRTQCEVTRLRLALQAALREVRP